LVYVAFTSIYIFSSYEGVSPLKTPSFTPKGLLVLTNIDLCDAYDSDELMIAIFVSTLS
jgi:hypothetical protein